MADEATDALIPDEAPSPEVAAPTEAPAPEDPFKKRYEDLRPQWDRTNTLLDRARNGDIDAIRELGFDVDAPDPTPDEEYEDPYAQQFSQTQKELDELKAWKAEREAEALYNRLSSHVDELAQQNDFAISKQDRDYILSQATAGGDISSEKTEAAFKAHLEYVNSIRDQVEHKTPDRPGTGQATSKQPDLDDPQERRAWMKAQLGL